MKPELCGVSFYYERKCEICCSLLCPLTVSSGLTSGEIISKMVQISWGFHPWPHVVMAGSSASSGWFFCLWEREPWSQGQDHVDSPATIFTWERITFLVPTKARGMANIYSCLDRKRWRAKGKKIKSRETKERVVSWLWLFLSYHNFSGITSLLHCFTLLSLLPLSSLPHTSFFLVLSRLTCLI